MPPIVILCTPRHKNDALTEFFIRLADGIDGTVSTNIVRPVIDTATKYSELAASLNLPEDAILIFVGHGDKDALLGPPKAGSSDMSVFYNADLFHLGPQSLLAFCCSSAAKLGSEFKKRPSPRTFLGFSEKIHFVMARGQCTDCWKKILHALASDVIASGKVTPMTRQVAEKQYLDAHNYFKHGKGKDNEWAPLMAAFLVHQHRVLRVLSN